MRLTRLAQKEVIDVDKGVKLGMLGKADLQFEPATGEIQSLIIYKDSLLGIGGKRKEWVIDWSQIATIGDETILIRKNAYQEG